jgi:hypothetical protein
LPTLPYFKPGSFVGVLTHLVADAALFQARQQSVLLDRVDCPDKSAGHDGDCAEPNNADVARRGERQTQRGLVSVAFAET